MVEGRAEVVVSSRRKAEEDLSGNYELREEIRHRGGKYFLQTSFVPEEGRVVSSFFRDGVPFDSMVRKIEGDPRAEELREMTKEVHGLNKRNFRFLLEARDSTGDSDDPGPHLRLAEALLRRNLLEEAVEEARSALAKGSKDSRAWMIMGEAGYRRGEYEKALQALRQGLELNPDYPDLHNLMGLVLLREELCGEAVECFERAISLNLYYGEPYLNLVRAYLLNTIVKQDYELSRGLEGKFRENLKKARQLNPQLDPSTIEEARRSFEREDYQEALDLIDSLETGAGASELDEMVLELYLTLNQRGEDLVEEEIEGYLERINEIIDRNPTYADAWNSLGILYTAKCKLLMDRAGEAFRKALEINEDYEKARKNLRLTENDRQGIFILLRALLD